MLRYAELHAHTAFSLLDGAALPLVTHLPLLAESRDGYANLATLVTLARQDVTHRGEPRVTLDQLAAHASGLFALTGCPRGWVAMLASRGELDRCCETAAIL